MSTPPVQRIKIGYVIAMLVVAVASWTLYLFRPTPQSLLEAALLTASAVVSFWQWKRFPKAL